VSIETDLKREIRNNDFTLDIIKADELIAVWRYRRCNRFTHSVDFERVPQQWRYSAPPSDCNDLMPCHVSYRLKSSRGYSRAKPAYELSRCHRESHKWSSRPVPSLTELDAVGFAKRNVAPYVSPILDVCTLSLVLKDLGLNGRAIPKVINGRQYIILSGYAGLRKYLPGTIYSANNRKIIQMAIGSLGITNMVKNGARLTIRLTVPLTVLECFLRDQATMASLIGHVASDLIKVGINALISAIIGLGVGSVVTVAAAPIAVTIVCGIIMGALFEDIDQQYGLTDNLVAVLEQYSDEMEQAAGRTLYDAERELMWRGYGFDIDDPLRINTD
jgi:hypothetical protein